LPIYIALLRGINVAGKKIVKMEDLRASFEALGFGRVRTYVQSGNVIFEAKRTSSYDLTKIITTEISRDFGFPIPKNRSGTGLDYRLIALSIKTWTLP